MGFWKHIPCLSHLIFAGMEWYREREFFTAENSVERKNVFVFTVYFFHFSFPISTIKLGFQSIFLTQVCISQGSKKFNEEVGCLLACGIYFIVLWHFVTVKTAQAFLSRLIYDFIYGNLGCLSFVGRNRLGWSLNNGQGFSKISKPTERHCTGHLKFGFLLFFPLIRNWNCENVKMVRKFPTFRSERKKRTTSEGSPQFSNGFSVKLLFRLIKDWCAGRESQTW